MEIAEWLRALGLERYEQAFRDNEVNLEILPQLTADDLQDMGVTAVGHRRKLLAAIAAWGGTAKPAAAAASGGIEITAAARPAKAERRQLTVMFVDLVGSTALAARLDPEEMSALIRAYQNAVAREITRFDGHIAKYMGDGVLAYFGWPKAHEDDAERAVRSGLALVEAIGKLASPAGPLAARIGIATGQVVVGELIGEGPAQEHTVVGETPNLAARLQDLAGPNGIAIGRRTRRLIGALFDLEDLGSQPLKGFAEPVRAWRVTGESRAEGRFEALRGRQLTPLVGREHELGLLLDRFERARAGEGQVVLLAGEAGIGKSRIVKALRERLEAGSYIPLSHYCSPHHANSALHPVIGLLERAAGFERDDPPEAKLSKLEALLALSSERLHEVVPLVAALLGVSTDDRFPPLDLAPQRQKQRTLEVLVDQVEGLAARQPILATYEDAHWIDPSTREALDLLIERVQRLPVLVLITFRPEFSRHWAGYAHVTELSLTRLTRGHGVAMVEGITGGKTLPPAVLEEIVAKSDGVPLFVEELTKTVLESGLLHDAGDRWELERPLPPLAIPATLHDSLMARLDHLAPAREVAHMAAAIGREFSHGLLAAIAERSDAELTSALDQLIAAELVFRRGSAPEATYTFKHALLQDAAYQSLLKGRRQQLHARIAQALEERFPDTASMQPELLAHHCAEAKLVEKAVGYRYRAGQQAIARCAMAEAAAQLEQALGALAGCQEGPERDRQELDLQIALGGALIAAKGYSADATGRAFARARELGEEAGDVHRLMPVLNGQMLFHLERHQYQSAFAVAAEMLQLAERDGQGDPALLIPAHRALSLTSYELRRFAAAREHADQVLALYEPDQHRALASQYAFDQRIVALGFLAAALFVLGYPDQAQRRSEQQLVEARKLAHPSTLAQALSRACIFCRMTRDSEGAREAAEALVELAVEHGLSYFHAIGMLHRGRVLIERGRVEDGIAEIERAAAAAQSAQAPWSSAYVSCMAAEAHVLAGRPREAAIRAADALSRWNEVESPWYFGDQHWQKGQLLLWLAEPNQSEAEACFRRAIQVAREQTAATWELRAATSLARLWRDQGRRTEAYDLLAPVYGWFTEGFETADLKDARALLDELR